MDKIFLASFWWRKRTLLWFRRLHFFLRRWLWHSCYLQCGGFYHGPRCARIHFPARVSQVQPDFRGLCCRRGTTDLALTVRTISNSKSVARCVPLCQAERAAAPSRLSGSSLGSTLLTRWPSLHASLGRKRLRLWLPYLRVVRLLSTGSRHLKSTQFVCAV
jgi:hypothetical protein